MSVVLSYSAAARSRALWMERERQSCACAAPIQEEGPLGTYFVHIYSSMSSIVLLVNTLRLVSTSIACSDQLGGASL